MLLPNKVADFLSFSPKRQTYKAKARTSNSTQNTQGFSRALKFEDLFDSPGSGSLLGLDQGPTTIIIKNFNT